MRRRQLARYLMVGLPGLVGAVRGLWWLWRWAGIVLAGVHLVSLRRGQPPPEPFGGLVVASTVWVMEAGILSSLAHWLGRAKAGDDVGETLAHFRARRASFAGRFVPILAWNIVLLAAIAATVGRRDGLKYAVVIPIVSGAVLVWPDWLGRGYRHRLGYSSVWIGVILAVGLAAGTGAGLVRDWLGAGWWAWIASAAVGLVAGTLASTRENGGGAGLVTGGALGALAGGAAGHTALAVAFAIPAALLGGWLGAHAGTICGDAWAEWEALQEVSR
jgi:hypothetical protein